ncbi:MAG: ATP-binding cassette domain-containing protein [Prevotellaceae bacterium]|jgi:subfamily B ATP-binding cassette protein MsbA|nr:ATP-binding cassette domain-containing protein [Prevotellaceae bacterium]
MSEKKKTSKNSNFTRVLQFGRPFSRFWPRYLTLIFPAMIFGILNFGLILPVLQIVFERQPITAVTTPDFSLNFNYFKTLFNHYIYVIHESFGMSGTLIFICLSVLIASLLANLFKYLAQRVLVSMRMTVLTNIRNAIYDKITRLHVGYFNSKRKGDLISSFSNDIAEVQGSIVNAFQVIFREPILIIGNLAVLFYMSYQLTIFALIALPISAWLIGRVSRKLKRNATEAQALQGDITSVIEETISGIRIIKAFNAQSYVRKKFHWLNNKLRIASKKVNNRQELASPLSEFFGVAVIISLLYFGGMLVMNNQLNMGASEFIVYIAFYYNILIPVKEVARSYTGIQRGLASAERIFTIIDYPADILKKENPVLITEFKSDISFKNVSFVYPNGSEEVLQNINFTIPKGKMYALVGHSGAGKSTIADLIPRFYDVTSGELLIDGINIKDYQPRELINLMGIVNQEAILFNDTVHNNIAFGMEHVSEGAVIEAAKIANAHEFIIQMPNGYQTNIGDRGNRLSGGQRQRLAIARAVLKNPPILILDEATSALDTESEKLVQDALTRLMVNRTSIVIAHRLSTIQHADQIIVLQKGQIIEQGTHNELLQLKGAYCNLCKLQMFK